MTQKPVALDISEYPAELQAFPDYQTSLDLFESLVKPDLATVNYTYDQGRIVGYSILICLSTSLPVI